MTHEEFGKKMREIGSMERELREEVNNFYKPKVANIFTANLRGMITLNEVIDCLTKIDREWEEASASVRMKMDKLYSELEEHIPEGYYPRYT